MIAIIRGGLVANLVEGNESVLELIKSRNSNGIVTFVSEEQRSLVSIGISYIDGEFIQPEPIQISITEEQESGNVREQRNILLSQSDIKMLYDNWSSMSSTLQDEWVSYRQELRDITLQDGFPFDVVWPVKPDEETISVSTGISTAGIVT